MTSNNFSIDSVSVRSNFSLECVSVRNNFSLDSDSASNSFSLNRVSVSKNFSFDSVSVRNNYSSKSGSVRNNPSSDSVNINNKKKYQKIRNMEYYGALEELGLLYEQSKAGKAFKELTSMCFSTKNIMLAYRNIKRNKGAGTPGPDDMTISDIEKYTTQELVSKIRDRVKDYHPGKVRRVFIPKPDGGVRPLGIPNIEDRIIQQCVKQILEPICEAKFHAHSYGFRPLRSTKHALARAMHLTNKDFHAVVKLDIKGFFDNVSHKAIKRQIWNLGIQDPKLLQIISRMLKAEIVGEGVPAKGVPQGGVISTLLSNINLNDLDWWLSNQWQTFKTKKTYSSDATKHRSLKQLTRLKQFMFVRYADDVKILCKNYGVALRIYKACLAWLKNNLSLEISDEKSYIKCTKRKRSTFLGIDLKADEKPGKGNKIKYVCHTHVSSKAMRKIKIELRKQINIMQRNRTVKQVNKYNAMVLGYQEYYNAATHVSSDLSKISWDIGKRIYNRLGLKNQKKNHEPVKLSATFRKRYPDYLNPTVVLGTALFPLARVKHSILACFSQAKSPYTEKGREMVHEYLKTPCYDTGDFEALDSEPGTIEYDDNRISKWAAQAGLCAITKEPLGKNFHCHHIKPVSQGGTDHYDNLVIMSEEMHRLIHAKDEKIILGYVREHRLRKKAITRVNTLRSHAGMEPIPLTSTDKM